MTFDVPDDTLLAAIRAYLEPRLRWDALWCWREAANQLEAQWRHEGKLQSPEEHPLAYPGELREALARFVGELHAPHTTFDALAVVQPARGALAAWLEEYIASKSAELLGKLKEHAGKP